MTHGGAARSRQPRATRFVRSAVVGTGLGAGQVISCWRMTHRWHEALFGARTPRGTVTCIAFLSGNLQRVNATDMEDASGEWEASARPIEGPGVVGASCSPGPDDIAGRDWADVHDIGGRRSRVSKVERTSSRSRGDVVVDPPIGHLYREGSCGATNTSSVIIGALRRRICTAPTAGASYGRCVTRGSCPEPRAGPGCHPHGSTRRPRIGRRRRRARRA